jgi:hypothetical protein
LELLIPPLVELLEGLIFGRESATTILDYYNAMASNAFEKGILFTLDGNAS